MSDQETIETTDINLDALHDAIEQLQVRDHVVEYDIDPNEVRTLAHDLVNGELPIQGNVASVVPDVDAVLENLKATAGGDYPVMAQAIAITALKVAHSNLAWWKAGQAVGVGNPGENRSGGGTARQRALLVLGDTSGDEKVATKAFGRARRASQNGDTPELKAIKKTGGWYELQPPFTPEDGEAVDKVQGEKNLPEGYVVVEPDAA